MRHTLHIDEEHIKAILAEVGERLQIEHGEVANAAFNLELRPD
jgi:hypothetical protein